MKNLILYLAIACVTIGTPDKALAQKGLQIGLQVMPQLTSLRNATDKANNNFKYLTTVGTAYGIGAQYGFSRHSGAGAGLLYSVQGQKYTLNSVERYRKVEYLKVPVFFAGSAGIAKNVDVIYQLGPQFDLLSVARLLDENGQAVVSDQRSAYAPLGVSALLFAGLGIYLAPRLVFDIGVRYDYGITNAENVSYQHNYISTSGNGTATEVAGRAYTHNQTWGLSFGIRSVISHEPAH